MLNEKWKLVSKEYMEEMLAEADNGDEQGSLDDDPSEVHPPQLPRAVLL